MFDILAETQRFAGESELLFDGFEGSDEAGWSVGSEEIPGVEAREVLEGTEELVTADCKGSVMVSDASEVLAGQAQKSEAIPVVATKRR